MKKEMKTNLIKLGVLYVIGAVCITIMLFACTSSKRAITGRVDACPKWVNSIKNPENQEFVEECAFNLHISADKVTQEQFNKRYEL